MRVTSGKKRGTLLDVPDGDDIRPTSDKVKQAIFNMLQFMEFEGKCLDLFSGSGAMGIEAISRMELFCDFVDKDTKTVEKNIKKWFFEAEKHIKVERIALKTTKIYM